MTSSVTEKLEVPDKFAKNVTKSIALEPWILDELRDACVVLASQSPQRLNILKTQFDFNAEIKVVKSGFQENLNKRRYAPFEYAIETAREKALDVYRHLAENTDIQPSIVIAADTVISNGGTIYEKPRSQADQVVMLQTLRDSELPHKAYTGIACIVPFNTLRSPGYEMKLGFEETVVYFRKDVTDQEIYDYVESNEAIDACGGYKIHLTGGDKLIDHIEGDFFNVMGLPVKRLSELMDETFTEAKELDKEYEDGGSGEEEDEDDW